MSAVVQQGGGGRYSRHVEIHGLIALTVGVGLVESATTTSNLYPTAVLVLDVLDVLTSMADDSGTEVVVADGLAIDRNLGFGPLEATTLVALALSLVTLTALEAASIDEVRHGFVESGFNQGNSFVETFLAAAGDVEVERGFLGSSLAEFRQQWIR